MFESVLIANRGEIALRVARTARRMGMRVIAVYSDADANAPFVRFADEAYRLGPSPAQESYLRGDLLLEIAAKTRAQALHPGYGFLSENPAFAESCAAAGLCFVGPPASAMRAMGLKDAAKALVEKAGVPVVPGYHGTNQEAAFLKERAYHVGYPVLIKAVAGGGGKGMRRVEKHADFADALASCQREAQNAFGDSRVLIEKYITAPRHVEMQIFGDQHGNVIHLLERDCSMQRRHQKVIEEAPAPGMDATTRAAFGKAAVDAARAVGYYGAGTVEFIADGSQGLRPDGFYFMEMNTRLQVEHPVTEAITGLDLVEWQFRVAYGETLPLTQEAVRANGHAVEARLYAEEPEAGFLPSVGRIVALDWGRNPGVRIDSGVEAGGEVSPFYDPMIAKLIAHGDTRDKALDTLGRALQQAFVAGPKTNARFLHALIHHPEFRAGKLDTGLIERELSALGAAQPHPVSTAAQQAGAQAVAAHDQQRVEARAARLSGWSQDPFSSSDGFTLAPAQPLGLRVLMEGAPQLVQLAATGDEPADFRVVPDGAGAFVIANGLQTRFDPFDALSVDLSDAEAGAEGTLRAPMHGKVVSVLVALGQAVTKGQKLALVEAMKMEHPLIAPQDGLVADIYESAGAQVQKGTPILTVRIAEA